MTGATPTVSDLRLRATLKACHAWRQLLQPVRPMFEELRVLQPEIERLTAIFAGELPPPESWEYRRCEREAKALAARLVKLESRIRSAMPGLLEFLEERSQAASQRGVNDNGRH